MAIELIPAKPEHIPELARICHVAFNTLHERHCVPPDVPTLEVGEMIINGVARRPDYVGVVAVDGDTIVGSNFICFADTVAGVGPITVDPHLQTHGVGRRLMQWVIDEARRRNVAHVRLFQEAVNTTSLSLYTKLGFRWRLAAALMQPQPAEKDDPTIRPMTPEDLPHVERLSKQHYGFARDKDVKQLLAMQMPGFVRERGGKVTGYQVATLFGHACADTTDDLFALTANTARHVPPPMAVCICPLSEEKLTTQFLTAGYRVVKVLNYMSLEAYEAPKGNWVPSIQC